jgi:hypothetical protein
MPWQLTWNYRKVIGILNYTTASSRLDISFAVYQCAWFSNNPQRSHEIAMKYIVRYLKGTKHKDIYLNQPIQKQWTTMQLCRC